MPITPVQEFFNKGLVNVRDASLLAPGEMQQCDHCVYRPFDPAIHGAPGRQAIHSSPFTGPVKGLAWLSSDNSTDQLVAYNGANLFLTPFTAITGLVWTQVHGVGSLSDVGTERMNVVKYDTAHFLLNGVNAPRRIGSITPLTKSVTTCTIASGTTITSTETDIFTDILVGQGVSGGGFPAGTVITAKNYTVTGGAYNVTSLTASAAGTNGGPVTLTFSATTITSGRISGMLPTGAMDTAPTIIAGTWPNTGEFGGAGSYWFFYTEAFVPREVDDYASGFIESACTVEDKNLRRVDITTPTAQGVRITRNTNLMNDGSTDSTMATHWIIYMSPKSTDPLVVPTRNRFLRVGSPIPISKTIADITTTATSTAWFFATATTNPATGFDPVTNPSLALQQGGGYTSFDAGGNDGFLLRTFAIPTSALAVTGIEYEINMNGVLQVTLQRVDGGGNVVKQSTSTPIAHGALIGWGIRTYGGAFETFTPSPSAWVGTDFFDSGAGTFRVLLRKASNPAAQIDFFRIRIHYDGFPPNTLGAAYRTVTYRSQVGTTVIDSAALAPPIGASTGAVFRGQHVLNSPTLKNGIVYSQVGFPEYFPKPYQMLFDSAKKDIVTNIKRVGRILVVGLQDTINRVNYLPTELDTDGQSGLAYEPISTDHGITGPKAAVVVDIPDLGTVLAYCSFKGIHYTDGIRPRFLNVDLNWLRTVTASALATAELQVYPAMNWIVLLYCPFGATHTRNTRMLIFDYSPDKLKQGPGGVTLPAIGPITVSGRCTTSATLAGVDYFLTGHEDSGFVYAEDQGNALPTGYYTQEDANPATQTVTKCVPVIRSRLFYAAGVERDAREERVYFRYENTGSTVVVTGCALAGSTITKTNSLGSVLPGMTVSGTGVQPGTIVISLSGDDVATLNQPVDVAGTVDITFDTGTLKISVRGQGMRDSLAFIEAGYISTFEGNLNDIHLDNSRQALELKIEKAALLDNTLVDLSTAMRIHYFTALLSEEGMEQGRP
jgi:hypothetical protein